MTFRRPVVLPAVFLALSALGAVSPCLAQRAAPTPFAERADAFRRLLFELKFEPLGGFGDLQLDPGKSLFIMLGDPRCLTQKSFQGNLRSFVEQGGAVLIATDMKTEGEAEKNLKQLAGVTVSGETLIVEPKDVGSDVLYSGTAFCPFIEPENGSAILGAATGLVGGGSRPDLFHRHLSPDRQPLRVAANAPSYLKPSGRWLPRGIHRLARLPEECREEKSSEKSPIDESGPLFAVGGKIDKGRVLVLADHSIFINRMILPHDNGNLEFAANCLHWLRGGVTTSMEAARALNSPEALQQLTGQRTQALFCEDGFVHKTFEVPLKARPGPGFFPSEPAIVEAVDKTIAKLEESDSFNRALLDQIDELPGGLERVVRRAVYLLTLAALMFLGYRFLWRARHRSELAVPLLTKTLREHEPQASLLDQRRRALLRSGNVWEMGHRLARDCFESAGVPLTSASPPRLVRAPGGLRQRWRVNRCIARLWRLARGDSPKPLSPAALKKRLREIDELQTALADGTITLG